MFAQVISCLSPKQKSHLRALYRKTQQALIRQFLSYGQSELIAAFRLLGIVRGDSLMLHSGFSSTSGFNGSPELFIDSLLAALGPEGNLLMVSMPYRSATYEYLEQSKIFDVRKTVSHMGILSETYRRRKGVLRSQHPTHPILAGGPKASWLVADHEKCFFPCGLGTPLDKLLQLDGKVLFFNASFFTFTFFHYLEERIKDQLDFPLFFPQPFEVPYINSDGNRRLMWTYVYSVEANRRRRPQILKDEFDQKKLIKYLRLGNSRLQLIATNDAVGCLDDMMMRGIYFYESKRYVVNNEISSAHDGLHKLV